MDNKTTGKKKGLEINENFDYNFVVKLNPALRWILVLPMGLAGLFMVQLAGGWIAGFMLRNVAADSILAMVINGIFGVVKYCFLLVSMVATAPVARQKKLITAIMLSFVPIAVAGLLVHFIVQSGMAGFTFPIMLALNFGVAMLGIIFALLMVRSEIAKPLPEPVAELPEQEVPSRDENL